MLCGVSRCGTSLPEYQEKRLTEWQNRGNAADMHYMKRGAKERTDATFYEPWAKSLISLAIPYSSGNGATLPEQGYGRIAKYAWGKDYHPVIRNRLNSLVKHLKTENTVPETSKFRAITDSFPILERAFAEQAHLGFIGKNTMLIKPRVGSYFFLAELITDLEIEIANKEDPITNQNCGSCTRCINHCPTGALDTPYQLDARRCISYLTIEKRGIFSEWEKRAIGDWIFGCDICQEVCPFNHRSEKGLSQISVINEFTPEQGIGGFLLIDEILKLKTNNQFNKLFKGTPLLRTKREGLIRNALCVAVNQNYIKAAELTKSLALSDENPVIRSTAVWAFCELSKDLQSTTKILDFLHNIQAKDQNQLVQQEVGKILKAF